MTKNKTLLGVDVGYSRFRASTDIAWCTGGRFAVHAVNATRNERLHCLPKRFSADVAAFDGPLVAEQHSKGARFNRYEGEQNRAWLAV